MNEAKPSRRAGGRRWSDRLPLATFALSSLLLAFGYGVATMKYQIFPHQLLSQAQSALDALRRVERNREPPHFIRYLEPDETRRIVKAAPAQAFPDLLLMTGGFYYRTDICPEHGCIAWIMTREGEVLHRWSVDPESLFEEADFADFNGFPGAHNVFIQGVDLDPEGNLVVNFQGRNVFPYQVGMAKFDRQGRLLWKHMQHAHHWPTVGSDGRIYSPSARIERPGDSIAGMPREPECENGAIYQEGVRVRAPDGRMLAEFWLEDVVRASDRRALAYTVRDDCDPFHVNGIDFVNEGGAAQLHAIGVADARPGDLIVSLRSPSAVVVMDSANGRIKHVVYGPMVDQHSPATLPDGDFLIFDNIGGSDATPHLSRILRIGFAPASYEQVFPRPGSGEEMFSLEQGAVNASPDGTRALVAETLGGRVFEVDLATGRLLWSYREVDDISEYLEQAGADPETRPALLQTQGAAYITIGDFERIFGTAGRPRRADRATSG